MINTFTAPQYLIDEIEELIELKYKENMGIREIYEKFNKDLEIINEFTRKLVSFENQKIDNDGLREAFNKYKSEKSMNLFGGVS